MLLATAQQQKSHREIPPTAAVVAEMPVAATVLQVAIPTAVQAADSCRFEPLITAPLGGHTFLF